MAANPVSRQNSIPLLKKVVKPVVSAEVTSNLELEMKAESMLRPSGEPSLHCYTPIMVPDAIKAAAQEDERTRGIVETKAARLRQFQEDVKKRLREVHRNRRRQQIERDLQIMETQQQFVNSNQRASDVLMDRKYHVVHQTMSPATFLQISPRQTKENEILRSPKSSPERKIFQKHNQQVHRFTKEARLKLSGRIIENETPMSRRWGESDSSESEEDESDDDDDKAVEERLSSKGLGKDNFFTLPPQEKEEDEEDCPEKAHKIVPSKSEIEAYAIASKCNERVHQVYLDLHKTHSDPTGKKRRRKVTSRPVSAPDLQTEVAKLAERRRQELQKLTLRRMYSDMERQSVRDSDRRKRQEQEVRRIKREKEVARKKEERRQKTLVEPRDPFTGETSSESLLRQQLETSEMTESLLETEYKKQKKREMARYLEALRKNLKEKLSKQKRQLPSLCCCGQTLWDTHPDTCANNCFFYKNHRAYARALHSLLTSSEVL